MNEITIINEIDLHTEMWIQCKITLAFKLFDALKTQVDEIEEILISKAKGGVLCQRKLK